MTPIRASVLALVAGAAILVVAVAAIAGGERRLEIDWASAKPEARFDSKRAMKALRAQVAIGPRPAGSAASRRVSRWIARQFRAAGLRRVEIQRPHRNVVGRIPGSDRGAIVVGAHHDTWPGDPGFVGANDGASGIAVLVELARALPSRLEGPSVVFAAFDAEEARPGRSFADDGTRGSRQFLARARGGGRGAVPVIDALRAMILFDMVGDCELTIPLEAGSDRGLYERVARYGSRSVFGARTATTISDDHTPFARAGIPAVDLIDFRYGPGESPGAYWHTPADDVDKVCARSLGAAGKAAERALRAWPRQP